MYGAYLTESLILYKVDFEVLLIPSEILKSISYLHLHFLAHNSENPQTLQRNRVFLYSKELKDGWQFPVRFRMGAGQWKDKGKTRRLGLDEGPLPTTSSELRGAEL